MSSVNKEFFRLLKKYRLGKASAAEINFLEQYYEYFDKETKIGSTFSEEEKTNTSQNLFARIEQQMEQAPVVPIYRRNWFQVAAACLIILLSVSTFLLVKNTSEPTIVKADTNKSQDVAAPANTKATITLADGSTVTLDSMNAGTLATQGNITVTKNANGEITYKGASSSPFGGGQEGASNTLSNPRGSRVVNITLADGSQVWLNAGSSLTYPVAFIGKERKVSITGEAYFEVAHDKRKPFYVSKGEMQVQVLGTHFNVNAYEDEENIKVTLLEGSVNVLPRALAQGTIIKPGEQAIINPANPEIKRIKVQTEEVMAWKDNRFYFMSADIKTIARQLSTWYDVDVEVAENIKDHFTGIISRNVNASEVFRMLQKTGSMRVKIEGRKIWIFK